MKIHVLSRKKKWLLHYYLDDASLCLGIMVAGFKFGIFIAQRAFDVRDRSLVTGWELYLGERVFGHVEHVEWL